MVAPLPGLTGVPEPIGEPTPRVSPWQWIPDRAAEIARLAKAAEDWGKQQQQRLADEWAAAQRSLSVQQIPDYARWLEQQGATAGEWAGEQVNALAAQAAPMVQQAGQWLGQEVQPGGVLDPTMLGNPLAQTGRLTGEFFGRAEQGLSNLAEAEVVKRRALAEGTYTATPGEELGTAVGALAGGYMQKPESMFPVAEMVQRQGGSLPLAVGAEVAANVLVPGGPVGKGAKAPAFFSKLERTLAEKMPNRASAEQIAGIIRGAGVKPDELQWTGFERWLAERKGQTITRADALDAVKTGQVQVQEVVKGRLDSQGKARRDDLEQRLLTQNLSDAEYAELQGLQAEKGTKYSQYTLPGGENYRELLLTLPADARPAQEAAAAKAAAIRELQQAGLHPAATPYQVTQRLGPERERVIRQALMGEGNITPETAYQSGHWAEPNVLAHVRFNDRTAADGKKVLFIEEVQSDWHQAGREKGYGKATELPQDWRVVPVGDASGRVMVENPQNFFERRTFANAEEAKDVALRVLNENTVPAAPFAKTWPELTVKRMIRYASENGYDRIAWTTGKQQADRYNLAKYVDRLDILKAGEDSYGIYGFKDNRQIVAQDVVPASKLSETVGQDIARRVVAGEGQPIPHGQRFVGDDLSVGGHGMAGFYDKILPETVQAYVKKWGGKVGTEDIPGAGPVHSFDLTPEAKQAALYQGQPLFAVAGPAAAIVPQQEGESDEAYRVRVGLGVGATALGGLGMAKVSRRLKPTRVEEQVALLASEARRAKAGELAQAGTAKFESHLGTYKQVQDKIADLTEEVYKLRVRREAVGTDAGFYRPKDKFIGWTDAEIKTFAEQQGRDPYVMDWWDALDPVLLKEYAAYDLRGGGKTAETRALVAQLREARGQLRTAKGESQVAESGMSQAMRETGKAESQLSKVEAEIATRQDRIRELEALSERYQREGFAGNVRLAKYADSDVKQIITDAVAANPDVAEAARRGVVSDEHVKELAALSASNVEDIVRRWKPGTAYAAETIAALRATLKAKAAEMRAIQKEYQAPGGDNTANLARLSLARKEFQAVQLAVHGGTAEAGRSLRQFRQDVDETLANPTAASMQRLMERLGGREWNDDLTRKLADLDADNPEKVYQFLRQMAQPKAQDYLFELWYNGMLSGPRTHVVNTLSNTITMALTAPEKMLAGALAQGAARVTGRAPQQFAREGMANAVGIAHAVPEAAKGALYVLRHGYSLERMVRQDIRRTEAFRGIWGPVVNLPSRMMAASDVLFRTMAYRGELASQAYRMARLEGGSTKQIATRAAQILENPPLKLIDQAEKAGAYRVFQQEPGNWTAQLMRLRDETVMGVPVLRLLVPFLQTPVNLAKYGLERSPLGLAKGMAELAKKDPAAADSIAKGLLGTGLAAALTTQVLNGSIEITGDAPSGASERDRFYREGKQPFAIKIGNKWVSYQRMEPFNQTFAQVGALANAIKNKGDEATILDLAGTTAATIGKNLVSQSYMRGISDAINAFQDPERYGESFVQGFATGAVPYGSALRTAAQAIDPTYRQPQNIVQRVQAGIPGQTQNVPEKVTALGDVSKRESPWWSPISVTSAKVDAIDAELGKYGVEVSFLGKTVDGIPITDQERRALQVKVGQATRAALEGLISRSGYQQADETGKAKLLRQYIEKGRDQAKDEFLRTLGPSERARRRKEAVTK